MKTIFLVLIFAVNLSFGQTNIEGSMASFPKTPYAIKIEQSSLNEYGGKSVATGTTDDKGWFNIPISIDKEQPAILYIGNLFFSLWVKPNTTVSIMENPEARYSFSGATAIENNILFQSGLMQPYKTSATIGLDVFNPGRQIARLDSTEKSRLHILNLVNSKNAVSEKFQSYYKAEVRGYTFYNKNQYTALLKATKKITDNDIPEDYFNFWSKFELENDSTASNLYQNALQNYIEYKALRKTGKTKAGTEQTWHEMFRIADSLLQEHPLSLQKQKTAFLLLLIKYFNFKDLTAVEIDIYRKQFPRSPSLSILENLWNKKQGVVAVTPSFKLKTTNGEFVDIKDLRGKVIYIDFWGSWCKACLINMPHAEKLKEKFKDRNVVFLYIDFHDTKEKWLNAIRKYNIGGLHLKAENSDEEYFNRIFNIDQGFPRYALVNKEGKLVTISAPQPQDQSAYDLIEKYLNN